MIGLMRSLAAEYAKTSLTVNAVCPGYVDTPMTRQSAGRVVEKTGRSQEQALAAITAMNASGRLVIAGGRGDDDPDPVPARKPRRERRRDHRRRRDQRVRRYSNSTMT